MVVGLSRYHLLLLLLLLLLLHVGAEGRQGG
jgi:hypothetical protein